MIRWLQLVDKYQPHPLRRPACPPLIGILARVFGWVRDGKNRGYARPMERLDDTTKRLIDLLLMTDGGVEVDDDDGPAERAGINRRVSGVVEQPCDVGDLHLERGLQSVSPSDPLRLRLDLAVEVINGDDDRAGEPSHVARRESSTRAGVASR